MELTPLKVHMEDNNLKHGSLLKLFRERIFFVKLDAKILLEKIEGYGDDKRPIKNDFELAVNGFYKLNNSQFFALAGPDRYVEIDNFSSHDIVEISYGGGRSHLELLDSGEVTCKSLKYTKPQCYNIEDILVGPTRPEERKTKSAVSDGEEGVRIKAQIREKTLEPFLSEMFTMIPADIINNHNNIIKNDLYPTCKEYRDGDNGKNRKRLLAVNIKSDEYKLAEYLLTYLKRNITESY